VLGEEGRWKKQYERCKRGKKRRDKEIDSDGFRVGLRKQRMLNIINESEYFSFCVFLSWLGVYSLYA